ncbi:hypothetical protein GWI33_004736 [Rhynchophorus ferrugineus]|uniref:RING-type domain-containing protein n=1 Tax=Rhynchophorus ferrugineus TaxID=354439 RepID=A0A834MGL7_RHYFE|nr:hypothetical protein GWI33_004736 [Rhynchophorus ferrugineus]
MDYHGNPRAVIDNFKCSQCGKHIFVSPITTNSDTTSYKCGRCSFVPSDHTIRMKTFEELASFLKFPCTNEGCDVIIPWGQIRNHEATCNQRVISCPCGVCPDTYPINKLVSHFLVKHLDITSTNNKQFKATRNGLHLTLITFKQLSYLLFFYEDHDTVWSSVYSVNGRPDNVFFQINFNGLNKTKSFSFRGEIIPFNDQEHCINCLRDICKKVFHKYSTFYPNRKKNMTFSMKISTIEELLGSFIEYCSVNIMDETKLTEDKPSEGIKGNNQHSLLEDLECPICQELMCAPIYSCEIGHAICNICKKKLTKCPLCENKLTDSRCFALEAIAQKVEKLHCNQC